MQCVTALAYKMKSNFKNVQNLKMPLNLNSAYFPDLTLPFSK